MLPRIPFAVSLLCLLAPVRAQAPASPVDPATAVLELAAAAASKVPQNPHVKTQARLLEAVAIAHLMRGDEAASLAVARRIPNWRRGAMVADVAFHAMERGAEQQARELLAEAKGLAERDRSDAGQKWRVDRIQAKIARVMHALGEREQAVALVQGIEDSQQQVVVGQFARELDDAGVRKALDSLSGAVLAGNMDASLAALEGAKVLYDRFFDVEARRIEVESRIKEVAGKLPPQVLISTQASLAETALAHGEPKLALQFVGEMQLTVDRQRWLPEDQIPLEARVAALRYRAGDAGRALADVRALWKHYGEVGASIVDIFRADALVPLAEAAVACGDAGLARDVYARAFDEAMVNPNARPRAEDLVAIACSAARHGLADRDLVNKASALVDELRTPW